MFLVVPKSQLYGFVNQADRDYFSRPVEVQPLSCCMHTRLIRVRDMIRNLEYPVSQSHLVKTRPKVR